MHEGQPELTEELRMAAAVMWYERGTVSQGRAAAIADLSCAEFIEGLGRCGVNPLQSTVGEFVAEAKDG